jgi:hypothetical protein
METMLIFKVEAIFDIVKGMWGIQGGVTADGNVMFLREN